MLSNNIRDRSCPGHLLFSIVFLRVVVARRFNIKTTEAIIQKSHNNVRPFEKNIHFEQDLACVRSASGNRVDKRCNIAKGGKSYGKSSRWISRTSSEVELFQVTYLVMLKGHEWLCKVDRPPLIQALRILVELQSGAWSWNVCVFELKRLGRC